VNINVGKYSTCFLQKRERLMLHDLISVHGPTEDLLYENRWSRKIGAFDGLCRMISAWQVGSRFTWAIEEDAVNIADGSGRPRRRHVKG